MPEKKDSTKPNVILTGFMATGKTTIGRLLADRLVYEFVDTDHIIEDRCGQTIADIFHEKGEVVFRSMEADVARELGDKQGLVIATGGGMLLDPDNVAALNSQGRIFCLQAAPEAILERATRDETERPLLRGSTPMVRIMELMQERQPVYRQFTQVDTTGKTPLELASEIMALL
jgi:shikimate kinase